MFGHGFHVHGPHDHAIEHAQQGAHGAAHVDQGGMINQIALLTKKKWVEYAMFVAVGIGLVVGTLAMVHV